MAGRNDYDPEKDPGVEKLEQTKDIAEDESYILAMEKTLLEQTDNSTQDTDPKEQPSQTEKPDDKPTEGS